MKKLKQIWKNGNFYFTGSTLDRPKLIKFD